MFQKLFDHMITEHNLILTESEMSDIIEICKEISIQNVEQDEEYIQCICCERKITNEDEYHYREGRCSDCI